MTYFELFHEPSRNVLADFDSEADALAYVRDVMINPDLEGLRLVRVEPGHGRQVVLRGARLLTGSLRVVAGSTATRAVRFNIPEIAATVGLAATLVFAPGVPRGKADLLVQPPGPDAPSAANSNRILELKPELKA